MENKHSVPFFLMKVLSEVLMKNRSSAKLLAIAVHAVFLEFGFIWFDPVSGTRLDRFGIPDKWPRTTYILSYNYTPPIILKKHQANPQKEIDGVVLHIQNMEPCVNIVSTTIGGSDPHFVHLDGERFGPMIQSVNGRDGLVAEKKIMEFWKILKDEIVLPLAIDLCEKAGLCAPPCFMELPSELHMKILELLPAEDIVIMGCVCKKLRDLANDDELWKQKVFDEFVEEFLFP